MKFYYINHENERIDLSTYPYIFQEGDLLNWSYEYDTETNKSVNFRKEPKEYKCKIAVSINPNTAPDKRYEEWEAAIKALLEIVSKDVMSEKNGKLYTDSGYYMPCKIIASTKGTWRNGLIINELTVLSDLNTWIEEQNISIRPITKVTTSDEEGLKSYPYTYPYTYPTSRTQVAVNIDHYMESDFQMKVYGATDSVHVNIAGHPYIVEYPLDEGEYMVIDSRPYVAKDKRLYVVKNDGKAVNVFHYRDTEHSVFQKIPAGSIIIDYSRTYGIDLTIFKERSEPLWS